MDRYRHSKAYPQQNNSAGMKWLIVLSLLILGAAYCLPLFAMPGIHKVDDTTFHVGRLVGLSNVFASPVNFNSFGKNGLMVNIFYPWLTMYPMQLGMAISIAKRTARAIFSWIIARCPSATE